MIFWGKWSRSLFWSRSFKKWSFTTLRAILSYFDPPRPTIQALADKTADIASLVWQKTKINCIWMYVARGRRIGPLARSRESRPHASASITQLDVLCQSVIGRSGRCGGGEARYARTARPTAYKASAPRSRPSSILVSASGSNRGIYARARARKCLVYVHVHQESRRHSALTIAHHFAAFESWMSSADNVASITCAKENEA